MFMHRPPSIIWFERFFWGSILVSFLTTIATWTETRAAMAREAQGLMSETFVGVIIGVMIVTLLLLTALWYAIARRASNVAKWIYVVLTIGGTLLTIPTFFQPADLSVLAMAGSLLSTLLAIVSVVYLFRADAAAWLSGKAPVDPGVFS
jgi:hypothetical protein